MVFAIAVTVLSIGSALVLALAVDRMITQRQCLLHAAGLALCGGSGVVAGVMWWFMFNPTIGIVPYLLQDRL